MLENRQKIANLERLNQEQKEAVTHGDGPLLIVAPHYFRYAQKCGVNWSL